MVGYTGGFDPVSVGTGPALGSSAAAAQRIPFGTLPSIITGTVLYERKAVITRATLCKVAYLPAGGAEISDIEHTQLPPGQARERGHVRGRTGAAMPTRHQGHRRGADEDQQGATPVNGVRRTTRSIATGASSAEQAASARHPAAAAGGKHTGRKRGRAAKKAKETPHSLDWEAGFCVSMGPETLDSKTAYVPCSTSAFAATPAATQAPAAAPRVWLLTLTSNNREVSAAQTAHAHSH